MARHTLLFVVILAGLNACSANEPPPAPRDGVEAFNSYTAELEIELTAPSERIGDSANLRAAAGAQVKTLRLTTGVFNEEAMSLRPLSPAELQSVAFRGERIKLRGAAGIPVEHRAPNGQYFTVQDLFQAAEATEKQTRDKTEWFGGVDVHHVYFEGIELQADGAWDIYWGS